MSGVSLTDIKNSLVRIESIGSYADGKSGVKFLELGGTVTSIIARAALEEKHAYYRHEQLSNLVLRTLAMITHLCLSILLPDIDKW